MEQQLSPESAAQAVLDQAHSEATARKNASARSVSLLYRFDELKAVEPWQRYALVMEAGKLANREPLVIAACGLWLAVLVGLAFASPAWFDGAAVPLTTLFFVLPFLLYQRARVRYHVRQLLRPPMLDPGMDRS